jgi:hypothetical protein
MGGDYVAHSAMQNAMKASTDAGGSRRDGRTMWSGKVSPGQSGCTSRREGGRMPAS